MTLRLILCLGLFLPTAIPTFQESAGGVDTAESKLARAEPAEAKRLLKEHAAAEKSDDAGLLARSLERLSGYDNEEFVEPALDGLRYRATKVDRAAAEQEAEELGLRDRKEIAQILLDREALVQGAAARLLGNFPENKKASGALVKVFKDKKIRKGKPQVTAAAIHSLGKLGYQKVERDVYSEFKRYGQEGVMRACVRYFGLIKTKDKSIVRTLCEELSAPEPGNVDSPTNPPASYWAARWKAWNAIRRDVSWALKEITGQVFKPQEGDHPGDTKKALDYVKENAKRLGLK